MSKPMMTIAVFLLCASPIVVAELALIEYNRDQLVEQAVLGEIAPPAIERYDGPDANLEHLLDIP